MKIWGIHKKYPALSWWENFMGGHLNIGNKITIFGSNAMCWVVNIRTKKYGYICFTLPSISEFRKRTGYHLYFSPNGTPWACTFYLGKNKEEKIRSIARKMNFGHNFNTEKYNKELSKLNENLSMINFRYS